MVVTLNSLIAERANAKFVASNDGNDCENNMEVDDDEALVDMLLRSFDHIPQEELIGQRNAMCRAGLTALNVRLLGPAEEAADEGN